MASGVFRLARRYMCWFVGDVVADVRGMGVVWYAALGIPGGMGCGFCFCCILPWLFGRGGDMASGECGAGGLFGVILHVGQVASLWGWRGGQK